MKNTFKKSLLSVLIFCAVNIAAFSKSTPVKNLYEYNLSNGLTLFAAENHGVPLVYIELAVRCGSTSQTPETAGLFHLYEHIMFKGNELYKDAASVNKALSDLGVAEWNGTTGTDRVNYFFTIPSDKLKEGLEFWNAAIRTPLMKPAEFESEKKVVLSEIEGGLSDPGKIYVSYVDLTMFPEAPYRVDAGGSIDSIKNSTIEQLTEIKNEYYIPSNAALFIGGDINPDQTYELVKSIFGSWSNNGRKIPEPQKQQSLKPLASPSYAFMPYDRVSENIAYIDIYFRGPDTDFDVEDTYAADYLSFLLDLPDSFFYEYFIGNSFFKIANQEISGSYGTVRANGLYEFSASVLDPQDDIVNRARLMTKEIQETILPAMANDKNLYTEKTKARILNMLTDRRLADSETARGLLSEIRSWWTHCSTDYYYTYLDKISQVTQEDVQKFVKKYLSSPAFVTVLANSSYSDLVESQNIDEKGNQKNPLTFITSDNAFWWKKAEFLPGYKSALENQNVTDLLGTEKKEFTVEKTPYKAPEVKVLKLKNNIPVYLQKTDSHNVTINIGVEGGIDRLTKETSGMENCLFSLMSNGSKKYSITDISRISYETGANMISMNKVKGSAFGIVVLDKYLYKTLPLLTDCFINPDLSEKNFSKIENRIQTQVKRLQNDPETMLYDAINSELYKGHPFEARTSVSLESAKNINLENLKLHHQTMLKPENLFVVIVGNVDEQKIVKELNKTVGKIKSKKVMKEEAKTVKEIPPLKIETAEDYVLTHPTMNGTAHAARIFESPASTAEDFMAAYMAAEIYSSMLFNVVREKNGACYTPMSYVSVSLAGYGCDFIYKISDYDNYRTYMDEAKNYMLQDKIIQKVDEKGNYEFTDIESVLEGYKNKYINSTYSESATTKGMNERFCYNLVTYGDGDFSQKQLELLHQVTAEDVKNAFKKYWIDSNERWFIVKGDK